MAKTINLVVILIGIIIYLTPVYGENPGDSIFAGIQVHTVNIQFPRTDYWDSLTIYYNQGDEQYIPATVIVDGITYDSVGVRFKGHSSYTHPNNKKPFRLSFDEFVSGQKWDGVKSIHLNNCWEDPTFMREKIHLDFCRDAGIHAPRANYATLYINDTLFGFYSLVEHVDKRFLNSHYGSNEGDLFKAVDGYGDSSDILSDFRWLGSDTTAYLDHYELKTDGSPTGWNNLVALLDTINNSLSPRTSMPSMIDMSALYKAFATDILFGNLDSYIGSSRNFYFYFDPTISKIDWIVWDAGLSFGAYPSSGVSNPENLSLTYVKDSTQRPLFGKIINNATLKNQYLNTMCSVFNDHFSQSDLFPHIDSVANVIRPYVYADPRKMYTSMQFESNIASDITVGSGRKPGLKSFINQRSANVQTQLSTLGVNCSVIVQAGDVVINEFMAQNDTIYDPAGEKDDWIELYNTTTDTLDVGGLFLSDDVAEPAKWQFPANTFINPESYLIVWADDDSGQVGLHASFKLSANGEFIQISNIDTSNVDSITFGVQTVNLSMARIPNGTGSFVKCTPTFDTINYIVSGIAVGEVVINEFCADNDSIQDPAGETDDWIEIYNTAEREINLSGLYLSDNFSKPTKWQFPSGTTISANSYLIVWADQDTDQVGLHALFALSAGGEAIVFSDSNLTILDSVTFGTQTTNMSMARIPNGTGPFVLGVPTFDGFNGTSDAVDDQGKAIPLDFGLSQNYPNPFNPTTTIYYQLPARSHVVVKVFNVLGTEVATLVDGIQEGGYKSIVFNAANLSSGIYFYRMQTDNFVMTRKLTLLK